MTDGLTIFQFQKLFVSEHEDVEYGLQDLSRNDNSDLPLNLSYNRIQIISSFQNDTRSNTNVPL